MHIERRTDGETWTWAVIDGAGKVVAEFDSNEEAWQWLDRNTGEAQSPAEDRHHFGFRRAAEGK